MKDDTSPGVPSAIRKRNLSHASLSSWALFHEELERIREIDDVDLRHRRYADLFLRARSLGAAAAKQQVAAAETDLALYRTRNLELERNAQTDRATIAALRDENGRLRDQLQKLLR
ncbi:MAG: hypothetical protein AAGE52_01325 [Myxococcota bacterium]